MSITAPTWLRRPGANDPTATQLAASDPPRPAGSDGWSPATITAVASNNPAGFLRTAGAFVLGGVEERPGQRLSTQQIATLAPFYASQFGLDEQFVRGELAKVYLYVGGPAGTSRNAVTVGHHIYVPDEPSLREILSPGNTAWLTHELTHTMQFLTYDGSSPHRFLAGYLQGAYLGHDPRQPGSGGGPLVWGSLVTAGLVAGRREDAVGAGASSPGARFVASGVPAAALGGLGTVTAAGLLATTRVTTAIPWLGTGRSLSTAAALVAAPALAGALIGGVQPARGDTRGRSELLGAATGAVIAGTALARRSAFHPTEALRLNGQVMSRVTQIGVAAGATALAAGIGSIAAGASAGTVQGYSRSSQVLRDNAYRRGDEQRILSWTDGTHDTHWFEIDAESVSRRFTHDSWQHPSGPVQGRTPAAPRGAAALEARLRDRFTWGVQLPLTVGAPATLAVGAGVLAWRAAGDVLHRPPSMTFGRSVRSTLLDLAMQGKGVGDSLAVAAAVTAMPLVIGGVTGPLVGSATSSRTAATIGGGLVAGAAGAAALGALLRGPGASLRATSGKIGVGVLAAAGLGAIAAGAANDALHPTERRYIPVS